MKKTIIVLITLSVSLHAMELGKKESDTLEKHVAQAMHTAQEETSSTARNNNIWQFFAAVKESVNDKGNDFLMHIKLALKTKEVPSASKQDDENFYIDLGLLSEPNRDFIVKFYFHLLALEKNGQACELVPENQVQDDTQSDC